MSNYQAARFGRFHALNPFVFETLVNLAREWIDKTGSRRLSIAALYERARWEIAIATTCPQFKLDNSYRAFYARLIMAREPDLAGIFETRASMADKWIAA